MSEKWAVGLLTREMDDLGELISLAEQGEPVAQNLLAARLATGSGVKLDAAGALYWYLQAVKSGYVHAMWNAGSMLIDGEGGIEPDPVFGMELIERAAASNENSACLFLAMCHRDGKYGKAKNHEAAEYWDKRAWDFKGFREFDAEHNLRESAAFNLPRPVVRPLLDEL
jgi:TPR repeat protein